MEGNVEATQLNWNYTKEIERDNINAKNYINIK